MARMRQKFYAIIIDRNNNNIFQKIQLTSIDSIFKHNK